MIGPPEKMTETPVLAGRSRMDTDGCTVRRLEGGESYRWGVSPRRVLRPVVHRREGGAGTLRARAAVGVPLDRLSLRRRRRSAYSRRRPGRRGRDSYGGGRPPSAQRPASDGQRPDTETCRRDGGHPSATERRVVLGASWGRSEEGR